MFGARATSTNPIVAGKRAILIVLTLPIISIRKPAIIEPTGTIRTTIEAHREVRVLEVCGMSLSGLSICGTRIDEYDRAIPT
jgi:hypothetical protein